MASKVVRGSKHTKKLHSLFHFPKKQGLQCLVYHYIHNFQIGVSSARLLKRHTATFLKMFLL